MTGNEKKDIFYEELKSLLLKYDAELCLENFGRNWGSDYKIVVDFNYDKTLEESGITPQIVLGYCEDGR